MPGTQHILDRIPPATTTAGTVVGAIPQVQSDERIQWGPAALDQVEGYVPRVQADSSVAWGYPLGPTASAIADAVDTDPASTVDEDVEARAAISGLVTTVNALLALLRTRQVIAP